MKIIFLLPLALAGSFASAGSAIPVDCYKAAMANPNVLTVDKAFDAANRTGRAEDGITKLCKNAASVDGPINCYLAAMSDPAVFTTEKAGDATYKTTRASEAAVELCGGG